MKLNQDYQAFIKVGDKKFDYYNDLLILADKNLHSQLASEVTKYLKKGARILDFGCGHGAFSMRLKDLGFDVMACDQNEHEFKASGKIPFRKLDFNSKSQVEEFLRENAGAFDAVVGVEVIEHVENPWQYLRDLKSLIKKDGYIFLSTPNTTSWYSRMVFLFTGMFPGFVNPDEIGHINPITPWELDVISTKIGLKTVEMTAGGELPVIWINSSLAKTFLSFLFLPLYPIARGLKLGWCTIAIFQK